MEKEGALADRDRRWADRREGRRGCTEAHQPPADMLMCLAMRWCGLKAHIKKEVSQPFLSHFVYFISAHPFTSVCVREREGGEGERDQFVRLIAVFKGHLPQRREIQCQILHIRPIARGQQQGRGREKSMQLCDVTPAQHTHTEVGIDIVPCGFLFFKSHCVHEIGSDSSVFLLPLGLLSHSAYICHTHTSLYV